jgi:hypothetical protein
MKKILLLLISTSLLTALSFAPHTPEDDELWLIFAHPSQPHPEDIGLIDPRNLISDPTAVMQVPVLGVLMEFTDETHDSSHDAAFFSDIFFDPNYTGEQPSMRELYYQTTNGRLYLYPAGTGDHSGPADGFVGWVTAADTQGCRLPDAPPGESGCDNEISHEDCLGQGGQWGSALYWWCNTEAKRAEAIRIADPYFDYSLYDKPPYDHIITRDELLVVSVNADPGNPTGRGNVRGIDPWPVIVEGGAYQVSQYMIGMNEWANQRLLSHEMAHQALSLQDLYIRTPNITTIFGYIFKDPSGANTWYPPPPDTYDIMDGYSRVPMTELDPWAKLHLGYIKPQVVTHDGEYTLYDVETIRDLATQESYPEALIIYDPLNPEPYREYFMLEVRTDTADQGLALWLIDERHPDWPAKLDHRYAIRQIRRAGHWVDDADALFNKDDGYDIGPYSTPRTTAWADGNQSFVEIYDISPAADEMTFKVRMTPIFTDRDTPHTIEIGTHDYPYDTLTESVITIQNMQPHQRPRSIRIAGGIYAESMTINTPMTLLGWEGGDAYIGLGAAP